MAVDYFLKIDGIGGESADETHKGWIDVLSWSWGTSQPGIKMGVGAGAGTGSARAVFRVLTIHKLVDKATPKLFQNCCNGKHISAMVLQASATSEEGSALGTVLEIKLTDVIVTTANRFGPASSGGLELPDMADPSAPLEQISFNYGKMTETYTERDEEGTALSTATVTWDLKTNKGG